MSTVATPAEPVTGHSPHTLVGVPRQAARPDGVALALEALVDRAAEGLLGRLFPAFRPPTRSTEWAREGLCTEHDPEWWFPENNRAAGAVLVCAECPVRRRCLESAFAGDERYGTWGGATEGERRRALRELDQPSADRAMAKLVGHGAGMASATDHGPPNLGMVNRHAGSGGGNAPPEAPGWGVPAATAAGRPGRGDARMLGEAPEPPLATWHRRHAPQQETPPAPRP